MKGIKKAIVLLLVSLLMLPLFAGCSDISTTTSPTYNEENPGEIYSSETPEENIQQTSSGLQYADNEVLIVANEGASKSEIEQLAESYGAEVVGYIEVTGDYQWRLTQTYTYEELESLVDQLEQEELVESAALQTILEMDTDALYYFPNDTEWSDEWEAVSDSVYETEGDNWGVEAINAPYAWNYIDYMTPIKVGLIDTMFDVDHEDLNFAEVFYVHSGAESKAIVHSHGTHVAGTMAAKFDNNTGIAGVYPFGQNEDESGNLYAASIWTGEVDSDGNPKTTATLSEWKVMLSQLIVTGVQVINISLGKKLYGFLAAYGYTDCQNEIKGQAEELGNFLESLLEKGYDFVIVQSAGNAHNCYFIQTGSDADDNHGWEETSDNTAYSAGNLDNLADWNSAFTAIENEAVKKRILVVGAAGQGTHWLAFNTYQIADFSNTGNRVDVMAPGVNIESCIDGSSYKGDGWSGTSMAAPHVAGAAAVIWSFAPNLTGDRVVEILKETANTEVEGTDVGMINLQLAMVTAGSERTGENPMANENGVIITSVLNAGDETVLSDVQITAVNAETGEVVDTATTDSTGYFELILPGGTYNLEISLDGYNSKTIEGVTLQSGEVLTIEDIYLSPIATDFTIPSEMVITLGEIDTIEAEVTPVGADNYTINWSSSDESVAVVFGSNRKGIVNTNSKGTTTITAQLTVGDQTITRTTTVYVESESRDTVLVLDMSSSMTGSPLTEMKEAAIRFCEDLLEGNSSNRVGIVLYNTSIETFSLTNDLDEATSFIQSIRATGRTDMESGLEAADNMLQSQSTASIQNVVIMADGLPNEGSISSSGSMPNVSGYSSTSSSYLYANAVIDTAQDMMTRYNLYSFGFFHDLSGSSLIFASTLMQQLTNQENGYYQVEDAADLQFTFGDLTEEITDSSKIIINIACPVDVVVSYGEEKLSSASNDYCDAASFGTLQLVGEDQDIKVVTLDIENEYDVQLFGTGEGEMNYTVNYFDETEQLSDYRIFEAVPITTTTLITSSTDNTQDMSLNIDEDGDGVVDTIWTATAKSKGEVVSQEETELEAEPEEETESLGIPIWLLVTLAAVAVALIGCIVVIIILAVKLTRKKASALNDTNGELLLSESFPAEKNEGLIPSIPDKSQEGILEQDTEKEIRTSGTIQIMSGSMKGFEVPIQAGETLRIGKDPKLVNLVLTKDYQCVSRLHCTITYNAKERTYYVIDNSSNGTYFSSKRRLEKGKKTPVAFNTVLLLANNDCTILLQ